MAPLYFTYQTHTSHTTHLTHLTLAHISLAALTSFAFAVGFFLTAASSFSCTVLRFRPRASRGVQ